MSLESSQSQSPWANNRLNSFWSDNAFNATTTANKRLMRTDLQINASGLGSLYKADILQNLKDDKSLAGYQNVSF